MVAHLLNKMKEAKRIVEILSAGHHRDIYEILAKQLRSR